MECKERKCTAPHSLCHSLTLTAVALSPEPPLACPCGQEHETPPRRTHTHTTHTRPPVECPKSPPKTAACPRPFYTPALRVLNRCACPCAPPRLTPPAPACSAPVPPPGIASRERAIQHLSLNPALHSTWVWSGILDHCLAGPPHTRQQQQQQHGGGPAQQHASWVNEAASLPQCLLGIATHMMQLGLPELPAWHVLQQLLLLHPPPDSAGGAQRRDALLGRLRAQLHLTKACLEETGGRRRMRRCVPAAGGPSPAPPPAGQAAVAQQQGGPGAEDHAGCGQGEQALQPAQARCACGVLGGCPSCAATAVSRAPTPPSAAAAAAVAGTEADGHSTASCPPPTLPPPTPRSEAKTMSSTHADGAVAARQEPGLNCLRSLAAARDPSGRGREQQQAEGGHDDWDTCSVSSYNPSLSCYSPSLSSYNPSVYGQGAAPGQGPGRGKSPRVASNKRASLSPRPQWAPPLPLKAKGACAWDEEPAPLPQPSPSAPSLSPSSHGRSRGQQHNATANMRSPRMAVAAVAAPCLPTMARPALQAVALAGEDVGCSWLAACLDAAQGVVALGLAAVGSMESELCLMRIQVGRGGPNEGTGGAGVPMSVCVCGGRCVYLRVERGGGGFLPDKGPEGGREVVP